IGNLQSNSAGDLIFLVSFVTVNGAFGQAIIRAAGSTVIVVARTGQSVERGLGAGVSGVLRDLRRPRIGPGGTVVFLGTGDPFPAFLNFYIAPPARIIRPEPLLPGTDWNLDLDPSGFDYEIAVDRSVALRAKPHGQLDAILYLVAPDAVVSTVSAT